MSTATLRRVRFTYEYGLNRVVHTVVEAKFRSPSCLPHELKSVSWIDCWPEDPIAKVRWNELSEKSRLNMVQNAIRLNPDCVDKVTS